MDVIDTTVHWKAMIYTMIYRDIAGEQNMDDDDDDDDDTFFSRGRCFSQAVSLVVRFGSFFSV